MASVNKVLLMGNLSRDVDLRYTQQGKPVGEMTVAVNRRSGEHEETCFVDIAVWGKTAENCRRYLGKGSCVYVEGYLKLDRWEDRQTGQARNKLRVVAESVQFISQSKSGATRATDPDQGNSSRIPEDCAPPPAPRPRFYGDPGAGTPPEAGNSQGQPPLPPPVDDDIPF